MISADRVLLFFCVALVVTTLTGIVGLVMRNETRNLKTMKFWLSRLLWAILFATLITFRRLYFPSS